LSIKAVRLATASVLAVIAVPVAAQDRDEDEGSGRITRVTLGPQAYPAFPGSDDYDIGPLVNVDRKRPGETFIFEAPDESFDFHLVDADGFTFGPLVNWEGKRSASDVGADLPKVKFSIEPGAFVGFQPSESFRLRAEMRKGVTGHKGWIGVTSADFIVREGDEWLFSIGPRLTWSDERYQDAWFGVTPAGAVTSGLPVYDPGGGIQAYGAAATFLTQLGPRWGIYTYAKYDRLTGDPADSPIVRHLGSRDQFSGGLALSYTFD
jgi:outer membrane scaffolding protein for murein synthesis (MipA/OmpV family)